MEKRMGYKEKILDPPLEEADPLLHKLIGYEAERQARKLILIPSESICPRAVREALSSPFGNIYAEGYPPRLMEGATLDEIEDLEWQLLQYRRYADRRFYKGCEYVHQVEMIARRRAAECFATSECPADSIYVNVQPLSGSAANNAVYEAFLEPGDRLMGMALPHGGHLTHGSDLNRSGKRFRVIPYGVHPETELLDYDAIRKLALQHRPRLIVAGYTSYPWAPDWKAFREIADEIGALLLADIAHPAGLVVAGLYPNPVGIADVVTFTTHKTLCGPRGAVILTTDPAKAQRIDSAVFPGEQGGPHVNKIAAMAVAFSLAKTDAFRTLQQRIVENARALAKALEKRGARICYGGTETHLLVIDLRGMGKKTGYPLYGEIAARILDLAGIVVNKNTIPGDQSATDARGIRLGTPWATQRGLGLREMEEVAEIICRLLQEIHPFTYEGVTAVLPRGKVPWETLERCRKAVADLLARTDPPLGDWGYPHESGIMRNYSSGKSRCLHSQVEAPSAEDPPLWEVKDLAHLGVIQVSGERAWAFLQEACTRDLTGLEDGRGREAFLLDRQGRLLDRVVVLRRTEGDFLVLTSPETQGRVVCWFRRLSEGYVLFDPEDLLRKVQGPVRIRDLRDSSETQGEGPLVALEVKGEGIPPLSVESSMAFELEGDGRRILLVPEKQAEELWDSWSRDPRVSLLGDSLDDEGGGSSKGSRMEEEQPSAGELLQAHPHLFDLHKPYFIGHWAMKEKEPTPPFLPFEPPPPPKGIRRSCLHGFHAARAKKMAPFSGWEMPIWYGSIQEEHRAVRRAAGLFDVTHMGVLSVEGADAAHFLDLLTTNYVRWLRVGESQYSYLLDPQGRVIDDLMIYRLDSKRYLLVVNAANAEKDLAWLLAAATGEVSLCRRRAGVRFQGDVTIKDLKDPSWGEENLVDLALQGPVSQKVLLRLVSKGSDRWRLRCLKKAEVTKAALRGMEVWVARTGYTGEAWGYEIFVHPDSASCLWHALLEAGEDLGLVPVGLGARDSLRTEAGLPLYGHELAGPHQVDPLEAGFAGYIKLHKPFFVGRSEMVERSRRLSRRIVRFQLLHKGGRLVHPGDLVVHGRTQQVMGWVTSAAPNGEGIQVGMALVESRFARVDTPVGVVSAAQIHALKETPPRPGNRWPMQQEGILLSRFLGRG